MSIYFSKSARLILASLVVSSFTCRAHALGAVGPATSGLSATALPLSGPKNPGAVRIGIFMPAYELGGPGGPTAGESVRTFGGAISDRSERQCDYVLMTSLTQKKRVRGFGALKTLSTATPFGAMIPGAGMATMAGSERLAIASTTAVMASSGVKGRAEVTFEYTLNSVDGATILRDTQKAKARNDGDDVVTPLIQKAATSMTRLLNK